MAELTAAHDVVLALIDCLPKRGRCPDAVLLADLLSIPEAEAEMLLNELEAEGCVVSATGQLQYRARSLSFTYG